MNVRSVVVGLIVVAVAAAQPVLAQEDGVRIRAVGDVMLGTDFPSEEYLPPDDGADTLERVRDLLSDADITFVNLEGPFLDGGDTRKCSPGSNCYAFRTPTRYGRYLMEVGVDLASIANNHARDFGAAGEASTIRMLDSLGIAWSGPPGTFASVDHNDIRVGMVAFHTARTSNYLNDHEAAAALVNRVADRHDVTVVSFHGGAEGSDALHVPEEREFFYGEDRGHLRVFTRHMVDAGADLVLGHGPHVPRAMEVYRDRLIAYSLGNFATYGRFNLSGPLGVGLILEVQFDEEGRFEIGRIIPTRQMGEGIPAPDPRRQAVSMIRRLTRQDFPEGGALVFRSGLIANPERMERLDVRPLHRLQDRSAPAAVVERLR